MRRKLWVFLLPYLGETSLQSRIQLRKSLKGLLNYCQLQFVFKNQRKLSNVYRFKDRLPFDLVSNSIYILQRAVYKYKCGRCNSVYYGETNRHLKVRSGEHIGISPLAFKKTKPSFKKTKPSRGRVIRDHLLNWVCHFANGNNNSFLKSKKASLLNEIILVLLKFSNIVIL